MHMVGHSDSWAVQELASDTRHGKSFGNMALPVEREFPADIVPPGKRYRNPWGEDIHQTVDPGVRSQNEAEFLHILTQDTSTENGLVQCTVEIWIFWIPRQVASLR